MYGLRLAGDIKICRKVRCCGVAGDGGWLSAGWVYRVAVHSIIRFGAQPLVIFSARGSSVGLVVFYFQAHATDGLVVRSLHDLARRLTPCRRCGDWLI